MLPSMEMERPAGPGKSRVTFRGRLVLSGGHVETRFRLGMVAKTILFLSTKTASGEA
jgi:hypothetical protein